MVVHSAAMNRCLCGIYIHAADLDSPGCTHRGDMAGSQSSSSCSRSPILIFIVASPVCTPTSSVQRFLLLQVLINTYFHFYLLFKIHLEERAPLCSQGGQRTTYGSWFIPSTMWAQGLELRSLGLVASFLTDKQDWPPLVLCFLDSHSD